MADTKSKEKPRKGLGKGLNALFEGPEILGSSTEITASPKTPANHNGEEILHLKLRDIEPNPDQPRKTFDKEKLEALASSIKEHGLIQPVLVKKSNNGMYVIIAGERRWRASKLAGLSEIPCILGEYSEKEVMELALIENLQREDLDPIEESEGYQKLIDAFALTQDEVAARVGKSRSAVANSLRLGGLSDKLKKMVKDGKISQGHARTLLSLETESERLAVAERIFNEGLNVRQAEALVSSLKKPSKPAKKFIDKNTEAYFKNLVDDLTSRLGTKVSIKHGKNRGKIEIEYYSSSDLEQILKKIK